MGFGQFVRKLRRAKFSGEIPKNQESVIICTETNKIKFLSQICQDYEVLEVGFWGIWKKMERKLNSDEEEK